MRFLLFFISILEDILLITGLSIIVGTTFFMNPIYGWDLFRGYSHNVGGGNDKKIEGR
ncbi:hypothetical protein [Bacillus thuringiensis]|uniref:hypothetical protein n=1 Tax=Bacillus thuringiensis TaxID=1428 RepID=UPI001390993E|nr:hypothetical protein [Bacillus thuringiensis]